MKLGHGSDGPTRTAKAFLKIIALFMALVIGSAMFDATNNGGWIAHNQATAIYIGRGWIVGEYRNCVMWQEDFPSGKYLQPLGRELRCLTETGEDQADPHILPTRYYGRIDRADKLLIQWRCQKEDASLTCWALD